VVYARRAGEVGGAHSRYPILKVDDIERWGGPPEIIETS
jgi:hypothetical protein